ncbi:hypothetical protein F2Q69_00037901 [Brassica cretica]|uniref:Uncharacterized protein n=1 Tax=Brassica cretica TaxID=69181 RepID=A0A8S9SEW5_BRACR|nr:hypothetical protein F2Q69_00037901 [Brassica cretica]
MVRRVWVLFFSSGCVLVGPITTAAGCEVEHAGWLVLELSGRLAANFGLSVLDGYGHVVVLVSLIATSNARSPLTSQYLIGFLSLFWWGAGSCVQVWAPIRDCGGGSLFCTVRRRVQAVSRSNNCSIWMLWVSCAAAVAVVRMGMCFEALGELFSGGSLSLRADHRGGQNY